MFLNCNKSITMSSKQDTKEIILDTEQLFKIQLLNDIGDKYVIMKSQDKYCRVDFICINKKNIKSFYIEHKSRIKQNFTFDSVMIGFDKVNKVNEYYYGNCIYVWDFKNIFYWVKHKQSFTEYRNGYCCGSKVIYINVEECNIGYDTLITYIQSLSNKSF